MTFNSFNVSRRSVRSTPQRINKNSEIESHVSVPSCCRRSKHKYIRNNFVEEFHWGQIPTYMAADYKDKKWLHYFVISFIIIHIHTSTLTDSNVHSFAHSSIVRLSTRSFITNIKITFARSKNGLGISRKNINAWKDSRGWINMYMYMNATTNHFVVFTLVEECIITAKKQVFGASTTHNLTRPCPQKERHLNAIHFKEEPSQKNINKTLMTNGERWTIFEHPLIWVTQEQGVIWKFYADVKICTWQ